MASNPEPTVNNLESDKNFKHFLLLPFFDVMPGCRDRLPIFSDFQLGAYRLSRVPTFE